MSLSKRVGYVFGVVYLLVGIAGFTVTGGVGFADAQGAPLLGLFDVNPLHNAVHMLVGLALFGGAVFGRTPSAVVNAAVGAVYLAVAAAGVVVPAESALNILALNVWDNGLHVASGVLLAAVGGATLVGNRPRKMTHSPSRPAMQGGSR